MSAVFTNPTHLYRSLLREITYLFDKNARTYFQQYVTSSFRAQSSDIKLRTDKDSTQNFEHLPSLEERHQLKRGRKLLSTLQRANQGYTKPLENVLKITYGRKGRRRRALMAEFMLKEHRENTEAKASPGGESTTQFGHVPVKEFGKGWVPPSKFTELMRSQYVLQKHLDHGPKIRTKPPIEEKNVWGKPMPECRIRNATKKWYAKNAQLLLPHLNEKEFEEIKERAAGKHSVVPKRRTAAIPRFLVSEEENVGLKVSVNLTAILVNGPAQHKSLRQRRAEGNPHRLTPRFLKRIYSRAILRHTPVARARSDGIGIMYKWECGKMNLAESIKITDEGRASLLFAPVSNL